MSIVLKALARVRNSEIGASSAEYAVMMAMLSLTLIQGVHDVGMAVNKPIVSVSEALSGGPGFGPGPLGGGGGCTGIQCALPGAMNGGGTEGMGTGGDQTNDAVDDPEGRGGSDDDDFMDADR